MFWLVLAAGALFTAAFWDEIKAWATKIIDKLKLFVRQVYKAVVYIEESAGRIMRKLVSEVEEDDGRYYRIVEKEEIPYYKLDEETKKKIHKEQEIMALELTNNC